MFWGTKCIKVELNGKIRCITWNAFKIFGWWDFLGKVYPKCYYIRMSKRECEINISDLIKLGIY